MKGSELFANPRGLVGGGGGVGVGVDVGGDSAGGGGGGGGGGEGVEVGVGAELDEGAARGAEERGHLVVAEEPVAVKVEEAEEEVEPLVFAAQEADRHRPAEL